MQKYLFFHCLCGGYLFSFLEGLYNTAVVIPFCSTHGQHIIGHFPGTKDPFSLLDMIKKLKLSEACPSLRPWLLQHPSLITFSPCSLPRAVKRLLPVFSVNNPGRLSVTVPSDVQLKDSLVQLGTTLALHSPSYNNKGRGYLCVSVCLCHRSRPAVKQPRPTCASGIWSWPSTGRPLSTWHICKPRIRSRAAWMRWFCLWTGMSDACARSFSVWFVPPWAKDTRE